MRIQKCVGCGIDFEAIRSSRKWCGECKRVQGRLSVQRYEQRLRQIRGKRQPNSLAKCQWCGNDFMAMRSDAKTCSSECKRVANLAKTRLFEQTHRGKCFNCGTEISRRHTRCKECGNKVAGKSRSGEQHSAWKGGRSKDRYGYIHILVAPEARKGHRYQPEHRLVWEAAHGPLPKGWAVHHINRVKDDNRIENLVAVSRSEHSHEHGERRIQELEAEVASLRRQLDGNPDQ